MEQQLFHTAIAMVGSVVAQVKSEDMQKPTPCTEWNVHDLLNHIINEIAWVKPLLEGKTIKEVGNLLEGDLVGRDLNTAWQMYTGQAIEAATITASDAVVHVSSGDKTVKDYLNEVAGDIIVHGWDLARAINASYKIDDDTVVAVLDATKDMLPAARKAGEVKEMVAVSEDAGAEERLLAAFGRSIMWKP